MGQAFHNKLHSSHRTSQLPRLKSTGTSAVRGVAPASTLSISTACSAAEVVVPRGAAPSPSDEKDVPSDVGAFTAGDGGVTADMPGLLSGNLELIVWQSPDTRASNESSGITGGGSGDGVRRLVFAGRSPGVDGSSATCISSSLD